MGLLRKPYEISLWKDEWVAQTGSIPAHFKEVRMMTIGSSDMEYQGRAIEPTLVRKTNGEVSFSFKMYYQFVDTMTGEDIHNPFVDYITNESKIKLNYNGEWFDLLVKNITEDSATKSYSYQLVDQHMVELSKNGFNVELDSKLMNNLGTAEELAAKVLADTDWEVESEKIVATQDEALVMLTLPSSLGNYKIYQINDENLPGNGAVATEVTGSSKSNMSSKPIYAFYSACSGDKPYRFQFIYKTPGDKEPPYKDLFETYSDRIIAETGCQYYIDGLTYGTESSGFVIPEGFTLVQDRENNSSIGNRTAISTLYRGRRYVYTQISEYHAGLDMYLEKYKDASNNEYYKYTKTNYITPNLIQNLVSNDSFKGKSGWRGSHFCNATSEIPAGAEEAKKLNTYLREYSFNAWQNYGKQGYTGYWSTTGYEGQNAEIAKDNIIYIEGVITDRDDTPVRVFAKVTEVKFIDGDSLEEEAPEGRKYAHVQATTIGYSYATDGAKVEPDHVRIAGNTLKFSTQDMYDGTWTATNSYTACLRCENLDSETGNYKVITNSGPYDMRNSLDAFTQGDSYIVEMSFYRAQKGNDETYIIQKSLKDNGGAAQVKVRLANFALMADRNGYAHGQQGHNTTFTRDEDKNGKNDDLDGNGIEDRVLFYARAKLTDTAVDGYGHITCANDGLMSFSQEVTIKGTLSQENFSADNYKFFIEFLQAAENDCYFITKFRVYKKIPKASGGYYTPDTPIDANNTSYNIETKYFPVIANDTREYKDIVFATADTAFTPILSSDGARKSCVNAKESNYFNIVQSIAETFECWPKFEVNHDQDGNIVPFDEYKGDTTKKQTGKRVHFFNYIGQDNHVGFKYGVNSKDIKRTIDSNQIVSKLIVKSNSNEYAQNGFCSIARAPANAVKDNVIYDFGYYANQGMLDAATLQSDLYIASAAETSNLQNGLNKISKITESNFSNYLTSCTGYYPKMRLINKQLEDLSKLISEKSAPLSQAIADYNTYDAMYIAASADLSDARNTFHDLAGFQIEEIGVDDRTADEKNKDHEDYRPSNAEVVRDSETLSSYQAKVIELNDNLQTATRERTAAETTKNSLETELEKIEIKYDNALLLKTTLNKFFYQRYSRFIQEGTWIDESYIDDSLYYNDAMSVAYNSSMPKVSYTMNVLSLAGIPGYELFDFKIGDQTFVEDTEFFGYDKDGNPYQEEVTITETSENLDDPTKNTIKIQNYENQFQDLFQRITATVQSVQYTEGSYKKAAALAEADAAHKIQYLTGALTDASTVLSNAGAQDWTLDESGLTLTSRVTQEKLRAVGGAILLGQKDDNGNDKWVTGITADGVSASVLTAGVVNTGEIQIMNGDQPTFRWDTHGITAYDFDNSTSDVYLSGINKKKGVRFDRFGLYGYSGIDGETWKPTGIDSGDDSIEDHSTFYLTWEGLKVKNRNGTTVRIGDNSKTNSADSTVLKVTRKNESVDETVFSIGDDGQVEIIGSLKVGSSVGDTKVEDLASKDNLGTLEAVINKSIEDLAKQIDGEITSWFEEGFPRPNKNSPPDGAVVTDKPAADWGSVEEKRNHEGDLYYDTLTGSCYRWVYDNATEAHLWLEVSDSGIAKALADAARAQATADGKMTVFGKQPVPPYQEGDIWVNATVDGKYNNDLLRCANGVKKSEGESFSIDDWVLATNYTDDSKFNTFFDETYSPFAMEIKESVDKKAEIFYSSTDPSTDWTNSASKQAHVGDLWKCAADIKDTNGKLIRANKTEWIWQSKGNTYTWVRMETDVPDEVFDMIDGKTTLHVSKPSNYNASDLWILEDDTVYSGKKAGTIMFAINTSTSYNALDWEEKITLASGAELQNFKAQYDAFESSIHEQLDAKAETWYQSTDPSMAWITAEEKEKHAGDLWHCTDSTGVRGKNTEWIWRYDYPESGTKVKWDVLVYTGNADQSTWNTSLLYRAKPSGANATYYYYHNGTSWVIAQNEVNGEIDTTWHGAAVALVKAKKITTKSICYVESTDRLWSYSTSSNTWTAPQNVLLGWQPMDIPDEVFDKIDGKSNIFVTLPDTGIQINEGDILIPSANIVSGKVQYSAGKIYRYIKKDGAFSWEPINYADADDVTGVDNKITSVTNQITNGEGIFQDGLEKEASEKTINKFDLKASSLVVYGGTGDSKKLVFSAQGLKDKNGDVTGGAVYLAGWTVTDKQLSYTPSGKQIGRTGTFGIYPQGISMSSLHTDFKGKFDNNDKWVMTAGSTFGVTSDGEVYAMAGKIGNMTIEQVTNPPRGSNLITYLDSDNKNFEGSSVTSDTSKYVQTSAMLKWRLTKNSTAGGSRIAAASFEVDKVYTLSYKFQRVGGGALTKIGGHCGGFSQISFLVDGQPVSETYSEGHALSGDAVHTVVFTGKYNGNDSGNNNRLYIQVNRNETSNSEICYDLWDVVLNEGSSPTPWGYSSIDQNYLTNTAQSAANTAQNTANTAQSAANTAQNTANAANSNRKTAIVLTPGTDTSTRTWTLEKVAGYIDPDYANMNSGWTVTANGMKKLSVGHIVKITGTFASGVTDISGTSLAGKEVSIYFRYTNKISDTEIGLTGTGMWDCSNETAKAAIERQLLVHQVKKASTTDGIYTDDNGRIAINATMIKTGALLVGTESAPIFKAVAGSSGSVEAAGFTFSSTGLSSNKLVIKSLGNSSSDTILQAGNTGKIYVVHSTGAKDSSVKVTLTNTVTSSDGYSVTLSESQRVQIANDLSTTTAYMCTAQGEKMSGTMLTMNQVEQLGFKSFGVTVYDKNGNTGTVLAEVTGTWNVKTDTGSKVSQIEPNTIRCKFPKGTPAGTYTLTFGARYYYYWKSGTNAPGALKITGDNKIYIANVQQATNNGTIGWTCLTDELVRLNERITDLAGKIN